MIQEINKQISVINDALNWIRRYKPEHYKQRFIQLVEERRKLRKIAHAESDNPGIAAFGKSQVGKSYLMSSILQNKRERFKVKANGTEYEFIGKINPIGDNTEATGVVTRFSSFKRDETLYSSQFPVLMKSLSVADIIIILSDGYFNDLGDYTSDSEKNIEARGEAIYNEYKDKPDINNSPLPADHPAYPSRKSHHQHSYRHLQPRHHRRQKPFGNADRSVYRRTSRKRVGRT